MRLTPVGEELSRPRLEQAREAFDAERRARCEWYESLGRAISTAAASPEPEREEGDGQARAPSGLVVLEHGGANGRLQPGLAIAWAQRHLDMLAEFEPALTSAYGRFLDGGPTETSRVSWSI
jgi:hypothetical protein